MRSRHAFLSAIVFLAAVLPASAGAETTAAYLASCKNDAKACRDYMFFVNVTQIKMDKTKRDLTCLPNGWKGEEVAKTITDWLTAQPDLANEPAAAAIEKAFLVNYPATEACRETYARVDPFPALTAAFLTYCETEPAGKTDTCYDEILGVRVRLKLDEPEALCRTNADPKDKAAYRAALQAQVKAVREWLAGRADLADKPRRDAIGAAWKTLYAPPCAG